MQIIRASNITHEIGDRTLFKIDELIINEFDKIGLIGRNGTGKTTLLRIIRGLLQPTKGNVDNNVTTEYIPQLKKDDNNRSGGEVTLDYIRQALNKSPHLLLLDEPTTNLDQIHIEMLEKELKEWPGTFIIVSHDRHLLNNVCEIIFELEDETLKIYSGNYQFYLEEKESIEKIKEKEYEKYIKEKKHLEEAVIYKRQLANNTLKVRDNNGRVKNTKHFHYRKKAAKIDKSGNALENRLEQLVIKEKPKHIPSLKMNIVNEEALLNRDVIRFNDVTASVTNRNLWKHASFVLKGGKKTAIIGNNGVGKTTLLNKILNHGEHIDITPSVIIGYFSQNLNILDINKNVLSNIKITSSQDESLIRTVLSRIGMFEEDIYKDVRMLSGGERVKVALVKVFLSDVNVIILDEPTNYLDINALEAMERLMQEYKGSIIFVSHDQKFIENVADSIIEIKNKTVRYFDGTLKEMKSFDARINNKSKKEDRLMVIENKIAAVLSQLSMNPSDALEEEFQKLLVQKDKIEGD